MTMANTSMIQLPSPTLHKTEERKVNSIPKNIMAKLITMKIFICHIRSITSVTKVVVIIMTPISAMPVKKVEIRAGQCMLQKTVHIENQNEQTMCVSASI